MQNGEIVEIGTVDTSSPHPDFMMSKSIPMIGHDLDRLLLDMERNDGFEKRDNTGKRNSVSALIPSFLPSFLTYLILFISCD
jgi:hypothetical protein